MEIELKSIRIDGGTQPRASINEDVVADYAIKMEDGAIFPPVVVFFDGVDTWLADGFHRFHAANKAHRKHIEAEMKRGTKRDAILYSVGANTAHGLRRTNEDKRRAVMTLIKDAEWSVTMTDAQIAERCGVGRQYVNELRRSHTCRQTTSMNSAHRPREFVHHKTGKPTTMKTENIGKRYNSLGREIVLPEGREHRDIRVQQIQQMTKEGCTAEQIAVKLGVGEAQIRNLARAADVKLVDAVIGKRARINNRKIIESAVLELDATAASLRVLPIVTDEIDAAEALDWANTVASAIRQFRAFERKLREHHDRAK